MIEVKHTCQEPPGEIQKCVVYKILCDCPVRLSRAAVKMLCMLGRHCLSAEKRMGKEDGGLARHPMECQNDADWENAKVITNEKGLRQRKVHKKIESLHEKHRGKKVLNSFDHLETWKPFLNTFLDCVFSRAF